MRPTTQIRANAEEALSDLSSLDRSPEVAQVVANLKEILAIATKIDARTGTSDPSTKIK
ncbi:MAG TPA: hypothetical protein VNJ04_02540 [Gemmatimonadaceae bacterium]|nr:hypothetical protein [Gemmatimonadaceae bacterium]